MKKLLFALLCITFFTVSQSVMAKDCNTDVVDGVSYGCDDGGCKKRVGKGFVIFQNYPKVSRCKTSWINDRWSKSYDNYCPGWADRCKNGMVPDPDTTGKCWKCKCPEGTYFQGAIDGTVTYTCASCSSLKTTIQGGVCWNMECPDNSEGSPTKGMQFGRDAVIWNGKCLPVCDLKTAGTIYDTDDHTYIKIQIKSKNAGSIGEQVLKYNETESDSI